MGYSICCRSLRFQCLHTKLNCLLSSVSLSLSWFMLTHSPLPLCFLWSCGLASVPPPPPSVLQITPQLPLTGFVARVQETSKWLWASLRPSCIQRHVWLDVACHCKACCWEHEHISYFQGCHLITIYLFLEITKSLLLILYVTLDNNIGHMGTFFESEIYTSSESWIIKLSIDACLLG